MLTTIQRVLDENKGSDTNPIVPDAAARRKIYAAIQKVTARIRNISWDFEPSYGTEYFTANPGIVNWGYGTLSLVNGKGQLFMLADSSDQPTIMNGSQAMTFGFTPGGASQVIATPFGQTPVRTLSLNGDVWSTNWYPTCLPMFNNLYITSWWGYRRNYEIAWVASGDTVQDVGGISASVTTITVSDVSGEDALFYAPRFDGGNLLRIENELVLVIATNTNLNTLSVRRGMNGTTAATHAQNTAIRIWYPEDAVQDTVSRQAAYFYAKRGSYETVALQGVATIAYPSDMVNELWAMLEGYQNE